MPRFSPAAVISSPEVYQQAAPLIATLADLGPMHAMPKIDAMLDTAAAIPHWRDRRVLVEGTRGAFVRLGPQASAAATRIEQQCLSRPSPFMISSGDADQWRFALARMGVALEHLPVFPPQSVEMNLRRITSKLER